MSEKVALITGVTGQDGAYLAELLLAHGADWSVRTGDGQTPLHLAAAFGPKGP